MPIAPSSKSAAFLPNLNLNNHKNSIQVDIRDSYDSTTSRAIAKVREANMDRLERLKKYEEEAYQRKRYESQEIEAKQKEFDEIL